MAKEGMAWIDRNDTRVGENAKRPGGLAPAGPWKNLAEDLGGRPSVRSINPLDQCA